jgi:hypothetical protein
MDILNQFENFVLNDEPKQPNLVSSWDLDTRFKTTGYKNIVYSWSLRKKISMIRGDSKNFNAERKGIFFMTYNMVDQRDPNINTILRKKDKDKTDKEMAIALKDEMETETRKVAILYQTSLLFKFDNFYSYDIDENYFDDTRVIKRLPESGENACFCDSLFVVLCYCNGKFISSILNEPKFCRRIFDAISTLDIKEIKYVRPETIQVLSSVENYQAYITDGIKRLDKTYTEKESYKRWKIFLETDSSSKSKDAVDALRSLYNTYVYNKEDIPLTRQGVAETLLLNVISLGAFEDIFRQQAIVELRYDTKFLNNGEARFSVNHINQNEPLQIILSSLKLENRRRPYEFSTLFIELLSPKIDISIDTKTKSTDNITKIIPMLIFPLQFITLRIVRFEANDAVAVEDKTPINIDPDLSLRVLNTEMEVCGMICRSGGASATSGGHYWSYFKTDNKEKSKWFYYNDSGATCGTRTEIINNKPVAVQNYGKVVRIWSEQMKNEINTQSYMIFLRRKRRV